MWLRRPVSKTVRQLRVPGGSPKSVGDHVGDIWGSFLGHSEIRKVDFSDTCMESIFNDFGYPSVTSFVACGRFFGRVFSSVFGDPQKRGTGAERVPESGRGRTPGSPKVGVGGKGGTPLGPRE